jgi:hypothetical protein
MGRSRRQKMSDDRGDQGAASSLSRLSGKRADESAHYLRSIIGCKYAL